MSYSDEYKQKLRTAEEVAAQVKSGDAIKYGYFNGKPQMLDRALAARHEELRDILVIGAAMVPPVPEVVKYKDAFVYHDWHWSKLTRMMRSMCDNIIYGPVMYHICEHFVRSAEAANCRETIPWSWQQVAPMDENGYFNFGPSCSESLTCAEFAERAVVEVVPTMPRCLGGKHEAVHISQIDFIVEAPESQRIFAVPEIAPPTETEIRIAQNIIPYIKDGCCIQLGIGGLPNAIALCLRDTDLKNLGIHTELFVDACIDLIESGQANGSKKQIDRRKAVYTFGIGTQRMYDYMNNNPSLATYNVEYTNDPRIIAANDNFISINQALQLDMKCQVSAESMGVNHITGNGGMVDYTLGAQWSKNGKSFICLPSTHVGKEGKLQSRIVGAFERGTMTTVTRHMVDFIVTEFGCKKMRGQNDWQIAENLIELAHPQFREDLIKEANDLKIWTRTARMN
ncbi:MAG TPA: acetyl-CoA hydrolase/transferase C-terminal domain-containing protein [Spirochaetota bacterium]|nr:acetyl-CoA hydrolase/transferase C-terminal domain-containing protein [Spirochaetota bacterium]